MLLGRRAHWGHVDRAALNDPVDFGSPRSVNGVGLAALVVPAALAGGALLDHDVLASPFVEALAPDRRGEHPSVCSTVHREAHPTADRLDADVPRNRGTVRACGSSWSEAVSPAWRLALD